VLVFTPYLDVLHVLVLDELGLAEDAGDDHVHPHVFHGAVRVQKAWWVDPRSVTPKYKWRHCLQHRNRFSQQRTRSTNKDTDHEDKC
jgi:hypothetical protein